MYGMALVPNYWNIPSKIIKHLTDPFLKVSERKGYDFI